jgi:hypothetical protein
MALCVGRTLLVRGTMKHHLAADRKTNADYNVSPGSHQFSSCSLTSAFTCHFIIACHERRRWKAVDRLHGMPQLEHSTPQIDRSRISFTSHMDSVDLYNSVPVVYVSRASCWYWNEVWSLSWGIWARMVQNFRDVFDPPIPAWQKKKNIERQSKKVFSALLM